MPLGLRRRKKLSLCAPKQQWKRYELLPSIHSFLYQHVFPHAFQHASPESLDTSINIPVMASLCTQACYKHPTTKPSLFVSTSAPLLTHIQQHNHGNSCQPTHGNTVVRSTNVTTSTSSSKLPRTPAIMLIDLHRETHKHSWSTHPLPHILNASVNISSQHVCSHLSTQSINRSIDR